MLYEVSATDPFMARALAEVSAMERENPEANRAAASVIVKNGVVIGIGRNRSVHPTFCPRKALGIATGQGYDLCSSYCHSDNHSESAAIRAAQSAGHDTNGADLYLAGHWWACQPCWDAMITAGIRNVIIAEGAKEAFDDAVRKDDPLAGKLKRPLRVCVIGTDARVVSEALVRVNFTIAGKTNECEAVVLLSGAPDVLVKLKGLTVYDYRSTSGYQAAIARLSQEIQL